MRRAHLLFATAVLLAPTFAGAQLSPATISIVPSQSPQVFGVPVTLTAIVTGSSGLPGGSATFRDGGTPIAGCVSLPLDGSARAYCTTNTLAVGVRQIDVAYSGSAVYADQISSALSVGIYVPSGPPASISIFSSQNPAIAGTNVIITATVSGLPGLQPTGAVEFLAGAAVIPGCGAIVLQSGVARCTTDSLAIGRHAVTAKYFGNSAYGPATSGALSQGMYSNGKPVPTIAVTPSQNPQFTSQPVTFTATLTGSAGAPTGSVIFLANLSTIGSCAARPIAAGVATCTLSNLALGTHSIMAIYTGNATYNANTSTPFNQGIYGLTMQAGITTPGQMMTNSLIQVAAGVIGGSAPVTGMMDFFIDGSPIAACQDVPLVMGGWSCITSNVAAGNHQLSAFYSGNGAYPAATSPNHAFSVIAPGSAPSVVDMVTVSPWSPGERIQIRAVVSGSAGAPTGRVEFLVNGIPSIPCAWRTLVQETANSSSTTCLTDPIPSAATITARYVGSASYAAATDSHTLVPAPTASIVASSSPNPAAVGEVVVLTATVTGNAGTPSGTVAFYGGTPSLPVQCLSATLSSGIASCTTSSLGAGSHYIHAVYHGDGTYLGAHSAVFTQIVGSAPPPSAAPTVHVGSNMNPHLSGGTVTLTAIVAGNLGAATGTVAFQGGTPALPISCLSAPLVSGRATCTTSNLGLGSHSIRATYHGSSTYLPATSSDYTQTVVPTTGPQYQVAIGLSSATNPATAGSTVSYQVEVRGAIGVPTGTVQFRDGVPGSGILLCNATLDGMGRAACPIPYTTPQAYSIYVDFTSTNANYAHARSGVYTQVIQ